jgi:hypothetical protein
MFTGPNLVTNGLVLHLDAANIKSLVSGSSTWYDKSGYGNNGTLTNSPTFSSQNGGSIVFDGTDDYANFTSNIDFADSAAFSVETVISIPTFVQTLSRVHWLSGSGGNSMMMFRASNFYMWNEAGGINDLQISYTFNINTIYHVIVTRSVSNNVSLYVNGVFVNSGSRSGQFKWYTMGRLGAGSTTYCSKFTSHFNRVYNRALTSSEILQNYNATKSRFNL